MNSNPGSLSQVQQSEQVAAAQGRPSLMGHRSQVVRSVSPMTVRNQSQVMTSLTAPLQHVQPVAQPVVYTQSVAPVSYSYVEQQPLQRLVYEAPRQQTQSVVYVKDTAPQTQVNSGAFEIMIQKQKKEIQSLQQSLTAKESQISQLMEENNRLSSVISLSQDNTTYIQKINSLEKDLQSLQGNNNTQLLSMQSQMSQSNSLVSTLQAQVHTLEKEREHMLLWQEESRVKHGVTLLLNGVENERLHSIIMQQQAELERLDRQGHSASEQAVYTQQLQAENTRLSHQLSLLQSDKDRKVHGPLVSTAHSSCNQCVYPAHPLSRF